MTRFPFKWSQKAKGKRHQIHRHENSDVETVQKNPAEVSVNPRYFRNFTKEEEEAYSKKIRQSEGFDVGELPHELRFNNVIKQYLFESPSRMKDFIRAANLSLRDYNKRHHTKYRAVELVRVNYQYHYVGGYEYYITFQAKNGMANDEMVGSPCNFQARVVVCMDTISIKFCRKEKKIELS